MSTFTLRCPTCNHLASALRNSVCTCGRITGDGTNITIGPEPPPEPVLCSQCGVEDRWAVPVRVTTNDGEEGHADVTQMLCNDCLPAVQTGLMALGFKDHNHGSINFLEAEDCPGFDDMDLCPTPTEYGFIVVKPAARE